MTIIRLNCRKCGESLPPIDDDTSEGREAKSALYKGTLDITHEVCPRDRLEHEQQRVETQRRFEARCTIVEVVEHVTACDGCDDVHDENGAHVDHTVSSFEDQELAAFTAHHYDALFEDAVRPLAMALGEKWLRVEEAARIIDMPDLVVEELPDDGSEVEPAVPFPPGVIAGAPVEGCNGVKIEVAAGVGTIHRADAPDCGVHRLVDGEWLTLEPVTGE